MAKIQTQVPHVCKSLYFVAGQQAQEFNAETHGRRSPRKIENR